MADLRNRLAVKIVDPVTNANEVGVDASGNLKVIVGGALPAGTNNIGDVDVLSFPAEVHSADFDTGAGTDTTLAFGIAVPASGGAAIVPGDGTAGLKVQLGAAVPAGTNNIGDVDIASGPTGASALQMQGTAADGTAPVGNPVLIAGHDGTNVQFLKTDANGELQVDVLSGAGADTPTNPTINTASSAATAAGASADLDSAEITEAEKLWEVHVSASVPFKVQIQAVENGTTRNVSNLLFGKAGEAIIWRTPHRNFVTHAGASAGLDVFRAVATNMDNSQAADLHSAFFYST